MAVTSSKRVGRNSFSMRRTNDWVMSTDVPTDITVDICGTSFALHKFPLVSRSGRLRKLVAEARDSDLSRVEFNDIPGGPEGFEMAAKFCYGINFEITASNVAILRCVAEYLEMTDDFGQANLASRSEAFIEDVVTHSFGSSITVLHSCEKLLPMAEQLNIVNRCVQAAGAKASHEALSLAARPEYRNAKTPPQLDWWAEDLSILSLDFYQRVLAVMRSHGMPQENLWGSLMHYAQQALKGFNSTSSKSPGRSVTGLEHEQRMLVETIVGLLPPDKRSASCGFLFGLLRTSIILDTTVACRLELERRISLQLDEATLDDLLIPSFSFAADTLFDTDLVHRLLSSFLQHHLQDESKASQSSLAKVAKLMDSYLAEVAPDANLKVSKFIALAEVLPEHSRMVEDGLYRAVDIFLKAHPLLVEADRKRICKLMDPQRLSQEACSHAAQNERLPAHFIIQVLYFEQLRIKTALANYAIEMPKGDHGPTPIAAALRSSTAAANAAAAAAADANPQSALRRENKELKIELTRMKIRLSDLEKEQSPGVSRASEEKRLSSPTSSAASSPGSGRFFYTVSRRLGKLNPFGKSSLKPPATPELQKPRRRRHSIS
ncbi:hypothetical protein SELMODRAFT_228979 [Selaginella moellendorffii]|uniref:Uncharacterized protein RPT2D-1 n=1 Tax=Selaginella moellendorffii TaxID=88036 RepID=D8SKF7_SELML|nr:BTB/POZ domain-containing protein At5g48800 [Selaginella moellendorffii]EFJ15221.1 hypothetical protein SELMODRAFT_228979 [Selaginella moellendorffii]|eukprot:XP_002983725.1 BTB/POZ domain-containing protein At5g48800 [Selaginella moellendorffii]